MAKLWKKRSTSGQSMSKRDRADLRRAALRLALQFTALIVVVFIAVGALLYFIVSTSQSESNQRTLIDAGHSLSTDDGSGVLMAIYAGGRLQVSRDMPAGLPDTDAISQVATEGGVVQNQVSNDGHTYTVRTAKDEDGDRVIQVAIDQRENQEELQRLLLALVIAGVVASAAAGVISALMARRSMRPLAEALALQRRFVADASHELRTPLTLLSTRAQLLKRTLHNAPSGDGPATSAAVDEIVQDSRMLSEILEDLLIAADPRETTEQQPLNLVEAGTNAIAALQADAAGRGIALTITSSQATITVAGTAVSIHRLFTALVSNALDHAESAVKVTIAVQAKDAVVTVTDDGPGFGSEISDRAFERFASSREKTSGDEQPRHYGLGLALVADVAARHGGSVSIEPAVPGSGATVSVRFPLA
ncbi:sensor histidine kinase [Subtercola frigoramans]|uniref:histidine kinase n=1 Tax=Subtercola frigoramans TaxID=120298 RepID=A0ABS2L1G7_9MICO|nr:HAMP domain-containing sensor histidine kinase [Subtercola frigoramans]MBM7470907.1 signal transduction histidine kinase [Subtercola frigoramans]